MKEQKWFVNKTQLCVQLTPRSGLSARRENIVLLGFAVVLVLGTTNLTVLQAQQPKPKESSQQNAKVLIAEKSRSTTRSHSSLIKRMVLLPVRAGKSVGTLFTRKSNSGSAKRQSFKAKPGTTGTQPMVIGNQKRVIYLHHAVAADTAPIEIVDLDVAGKPIELGQMFEFDHDWLKQLRIRVRNVSNKRISFVSFGGGLVKGVDEGLKFSESYQEGVTWLVGKYVDTTRDERKVMRAVLRPGETVELSYLYLDQYSKDARASKQGAFSQLVIGPQLIQFDDGTTEPDAKIKYVSSPRMLPENTAPPTAAMRCQYWRSKVDETLTPPPRVDIDSSDPGNIVEAINCLLQMEGNKHPARFSGATQTYVSQLFEPATADVGALYYITYLYTQNWEHADAIALQAKDGAINAPRDIEIAYESYRRWFEQVKAVGMVEARQMNLRPLKDTNIDWY